MDGRDIGAALVGNLHFGVMADLFFRSALLPTGWAASVRITVGSDGAFADVEPDSEPASGSDEHGIAVPGMTNVHSHAFQRAMAGLTEVRGPEGDTFWTWRSRMYDFVARLTPEDVEAIATQLYADLLRHGFTSVVEFHYLRNPPGGGRYDDPTLMGQRLLSASRAAGIGMTLLPAVYRASGFGGALPEPAQERFVADVSEFLNDVAAFNRATKDDPDRCAGLALHSLRAVSPDDLDETLRAYRREVPEGPIHIHVAEQIREVEECLAWSGARPVEWLLANAPVDSTWCLIHATHMNSAEVEAFAGSGAVAGLCPTTEANLGDGLFELPSYLAAKGRLAVGTDSHVGLSPAGELRLLEYGQRLTLRARNLSAGSPGVSTGRRLIDLALEGGSQASGRPGGQIAVGCRADLVVLDDTLPCLTGRQGDEVLDAWIFSGDDTPVGDVMVGGRWVVRECRHVDQDGIADRYRQVMTALLQ